MMGGLSHGLELNTFEIAGELARRLSAQCRYLAAPIYAGTPRSRDTILAQEMYKEVLARVDRSSLRSSAWAISPTLALDPARPAARYVARRAPSKGAVGDVLGQFIDEGRPIDHAINSARSRCRSSGCQR